jgi:hypothetical protein
MKKIIIYCFSALSFLVLDSCSSSSSSVSGGSPVHSQYFNITIPYDSWELKQDSEYKAGERIWLHNGFFGSSMFPADYPIIDILVLRNTIPDSIVDEKMLSNRLNEMALIEVKKIVDSVWSRYIVKNFYYHHFKEKNAEYYQLHYSVYWTEEQIYTEGAIPDTVEYYFGDGICQYAIYLPESYNKYKSYYLFIYNVFLWQNLHNSIGHWVNSIECIEDSVKN